jgi:hypothetical protein
LLAAIRDACGKCYHPDSNTAHRHDECSFSWRAGQVGQRLTDFHGERGILKRSGRPILDAGGGVVKRCDRPFRLTPQLLQENYPADPVVDLPPARLLAGWETFCQTHGATPNRRSFRLLLDHQLPVDALLEPTAKDGPGELGSNRICQDATRYHPVADR